MDIEADDPKLYAAIAAHLAPRQPEPARAASQRMHLFDRVRRSALAHRDYLTVRREDGAWQTDAHGVRVRTLCADRGHGSHSRVEMVHLPDTAVLPWPQGVTAQEILVLGGALMAPRMEPGTPPGTDPLTPPRYTYHLRHRASYGTPLHAQGATTLYVRHLLVEAQSLSPLEAQWWQPGGQASIVITPRSDAWIGMTPGIEVLPLRQENDVMSTLVRFAPGASVADHVHPLNEDCLVLDGELFLGDILLRTGDYQLAPAGGKHFGVASDVGALLFIHSAIDPVLMGKK